MQAVPELTLQALTELGVKGADFYALCLRRACDKHPPPFGMAWYGERYRSVALDPHWLAASLVANAQKEGEGSRKLWRLSARANDPLVAEAVWRHAVDESRHARLYIAMLDAAFPNAVDDKLRPELLALSPGFGLTHKPETVPPAARESVIDELIQMNLGEIRTRIHQLLLRPMISAIAAPQALPTVQRILDALLLDETRHIAYTARLIEQASRSGHGAFVEQTMTLRLADFNDLTLHEVGIEQFVGE